MSLSVDKALSKAKSCAKKGDVDEAANHYRAVLEKFPKNAMAQSGLASLTFPAPPKDQMLALLALFKQERFLELTQKAAPLVAQFPNAFMLHSMLGIANAGLRRYDVAIMHYGRARELKPDNAEVHNNLGNALREDDRSAAAIESFRRAIELKPDFSMAHNNLAIALSERGDQSEAIESFERALQALPVFVEAYRNYSATIKFKPDNAFIAPMRALVGSDALSDRDRKDLNFALAKAELDLGNNGPGIDYLKTANALRKQELDYKLSDDEERFSSIKAFFENAEDVPVAASGNNAQPIFILGIPRSGTTLVEQIISSHSRVFAAGELMALTDAVLNSKWQSSEDRSEIFGNVRSAYLARLARISDAPVITDKMPSNFQWVGFILNAFPEARMVHLKRDPAAVCWSIFKTYFPSKGLGFTFDLEDLARYYKLYEDLMAFWERKFPGRIHHLGYEALTENQEEESRKLLAYLELDWEDAVLDFHKTERSVRTVSNAQVRNKMYTGSSNQWKAYEEYLKPMLDILQA